MASPLAVKLEGHLRFMSVGAGRNPRPREAQGAGRIDAAILAGDDGRLIRPRGKHRHAVPAADLKIDLGLRRLEVVCGSVPAGHRVGLDPGGEHLFGRGVDLLFQSDRRFRSAGHGGDLGMQLASRLVSPFPLSLDRAQNDRIEPRVGGRLPRRGQTIGLGKLSREHLVEDDTRGIDVGAVIDRLGRS